MRRSFGGGGSMGGGSGGGGGAMFRTARRIIRAGSGGGGGPPEPTSSSGSSTTTHAAADSRSGEQLSKNQSEPPLASLTLSSDGPKNGSPAFSTLINLLKPGAPVPDEWGSCGDDDVEWVCLDACNEHESVVSLDDDLVFGTVPSRDEVNYAISALQQACRPVSPAHIATEKFSIAVNEDNSSEGSEKIISSSSSEVDWIEPSLALGSSRMLRPYGLDRVYDAFHLLQTDEQGLNNNSIDKAADDDNNPVEDILSWFLVNTKVKIMQLIEKLMELANTFFGPSNEEKKGGESDPLQEKLKTSLFLSIIVLLIVVVTRAKSA
ncbi:hypothetical protein STAS_11331 [Striga asiatica]|uniref:Uncharacterized protein n=1 Tax=Striga asiatica TaxID=4170 RepID=A0A5A7PR46_STRAF|nr:hypothetical protein STAS_11331 [Striga asiatica]